MEALVIQAKCKGTATNEKQNVLFAQQSLKSQTKPESWKYGELSQYGVCEGMV